MEQVLQRCIENLQKEHDTTLRKFRDEINRLQTKCADYQEQLTLEKTKVTEGFVTDLHHFCVQHAQHGHIRVDLLARFLQSKLASSSGLESEQATSTSLPCPPPPPPPLAPIASRKRCRADRDDSMDADSTTSSSCSFLSSPQTQRRRLLGLSSSSAASAATPALQGPASPLSYHHQPMFPTFSSPTFCAFQSQNGQQNGNVGTFQAPTLKASLR